jgi:putative endonuclease
VAKYNNTFGRQGEDAAAAWYRAAGYRILERNWRCARGEIDLIVALDSTVVFVEVKARSSARFGSGFEAVDWRKQRRVRQLARLWLSEREPVGDNTVEFYQDIRFDVVDVDRPGNVRVRQHCF